MPHPQVNDLPPDSLPGNEPILTDAEKQLLAEVDAPVVPDPDPGAAPPADPAATPPAGTTPETPPPGGVSASEPVVAVVDAAPAPSSLPTLQMDARDFKAEREALDARFGEQLTALKGKFADGSLEDEAYEEERERLLEARAAEREELTSARVKWETRAELAEEFADHTWKQSVTSFLAHADNAMLSRSEEMQELWQKCMQRAVNEKAAAGTPLQTDAQIMLEGRNLLFQQLGLSATSPNAPPPGPTEAPKPAAVPPKLDNLPPSLGNVPGAAPNGAVVTGEALASLEINSLESQMAGMSDAQIDQLLRTTAGAFIDD